MRESDEPLTDTLVRCLADPTDLKALERLENDGCVLSSWGLRFVRCFSAV